MTVELTRRELLEALPALIAVGCRRTEAMPASCNDTTSLSAADAATRTTLGYVDKSPNDGQRCASCQQFVAAQESGACGGCKLLKGPIHPRGYCKAFAAKS